MYKTITVTTDTHEALKRVSKERKESMSKVVAMATDVLSEDTTGTLVVVTPGIATLLDKLKDINPSVYLLDIERMLTLALEEGDYV